MTTTLVSPLAESRPLAQRWQAAPLALVRPSQPTLDLRPPAEPLVISAPADPAAASVPGLPDVQAWSQALATTLLEVLARRRPVEQLSRWLAEEALAGLARQLVGRRSSGEAALRRATVDAAPGRLQSVRLQHPATGVAEVSVHARCGLRSVALAFRLEASPGRWLCTAVALGPGTGPTGPATAR